MRTEAETNTADGVQGSQERHQQQRNVNPAPVPALFQVGDFQAGEPSERFSFFRRQNKFLMLHVLPKGCLLLGRIVFSG